MPVPKTSKDAKARSRDDGRRQLLVYMAPEAIRDLKKAALEESRNAYEIVEEIVQEWLAARKKGKRSRS